MNYDNIDFYFSDDGDLSLGDSGDIADTSYDHIVSLQQQVIFAMKNDLGDWVEYPTIGTNLREFVGEPNTRENARKIEAKVKNVLINAISIQKQDLEVNVNAAGVHSVYIEIIINADATIKNSVTDLLVMTFFFDSTDGSLLWAPINPGGT